MAKKVRLNYFPHNSNARNSDELLRLRMTLGNEGYAIYFMLLERLRDSDAYNGRRDYNAIAFDLRCQPDIVKQVIEGYSLFELSPDGKSFYSRDLCEQMQQMDEVSERMREMGRASGIARRKKSERDVNETLNVGSNVRSTPTNTTNQPIQPTNETNQQNNQPTSSAPRAQEGGGGNISSILREQMQQVGAAAAAQGAGRAAAQGAAAAAGTSVPGTTTERNTSGLLELMTQVGITDEQERTQIMRLSNHGQIGHPVWKHLCALRDGRLATHINLPGRYVLAKLRGG